MSAATKSATLTYAAPPVPPPLPAPQPEGNEMLYAALQHGAYRLRRPVKLQLAEERDAVSVTWEEAQIRVTGRTLGDALTSLRAAIISKAPELERFVQTVA